jgi:hypothetical protein
LQRLHIVIDVPQTRCNIENAPTCTRDFTARNVPGQVGVARIGRLRQNRVGVGRKADIGVPDCRAATVTRGDIGEIRLKPHAGNKQEFVARHRTREMHRGRRGIDLQRGCEAGLLNRGRARQHDRCACVADMDGSTALDKLHALKSEKAAIVHKGANRSCILKK